ncbi:MULTISPECIES: GNAT family N-acetyltransferase [unclassified Sphingomonas]|uniref:GNAT family N-acetyltransferase n=1 Tax=unclassified Sphingomonas TaxID=196159 RepID=UPI0006F55C05|nr:MULTISPECIES: GNAT family N-acetyltransferase [unclassified Sphingomonas]KQM24882.1 acetyltransferase [Sphingomonas sp. Leaf9]KQM42540.1 acetyltransferase [Sphingomonas sp. Leaf11]
MDRQPILIGDLVTVRPTTAGDYDALYGVASDPAIWDQHPAHDRWQTGVFRAFFDEGLAGGGMLTIRDAGDGRIIGSSRYGPHDVEADEIEIGWTFFARDCWRRGYNREAKRLMIDHVARHVGAVTFHIGEDNARSRAAVAALGATLRPGSVAVLRGGRMVPHVLYELRRA